MNCQEINPKLYLLADEELMDSEMQAVKGHLAECADCRTLLVLLERENAILSKAATVLPWEPERIRLLEKRLSRYIERPDRWWRTGTAFRRQILAFASALMLVLGGAMHFRGDQRVLAQSISRLQSGLILVRFQWNQQIPQDLSSPQRRQDNGR